MKLVTPLLLFLGALFVSLQSAAQCIPDSLITGPPGVYPDTLEQVPGCQYSETDITFLLPRDTTTEIFGQTLTLPFNYFRIDSVKGIPDGMSWACDLAPACQYDVSPGALSPDTFGCVKIFGTPSIPGTYTLVVYLTANVTLIGNPTDQVATYSKELSVGGCVVNTDCYTYQLEEICAPSLLDLTNNINPAIVPPGKTTWSLTRDQGVVYQSIDFSPDPVVLTDPGEYILSYTAEVDTLPWQLDSIVLQTVNCSDLLDGPDLFWTLTDPGGVVLVNTAGAPVNNASLPLLLQSGTLNLKQGVYTLEVWDEDPFGGNDPCGSGNGLTFAIPPSSVGPNTFSVNGLTATFWVSKPVVQVACSDTFQLFAPPQVPVIEADTTILCSGDTLTLRTSAADSLVWYRNFSIMPGEHDSLLTVTESGFYQVESRSPQSLCASLSDWIYVEVISVPSPSIVYDGNGTFTISGAMQGLSYEWYNDQNMLQGTGASFSPTNSGIFYAVAIDIATGCQSPPTRSLSIILTSVQGLIPGASLHIFPNPASSYLSVSLELERPQNISWRVIDVMGRTLALGEGEGTNIRERIDTSSWARGLYFVRVDAPDGHLVRRVLLY